MNFSSLGWRGASIVAIPLLFQLVLSVWFTTHFLSILDEVGRQSGKRDFIGDCYALESKIIETFCELQMGADTNGRVDPASSRRDLKKIDQNVESIVKRSASDPSKQLLSKKLQAVFVEAHAFFEWFFAEQARGAANWKRAKKDFPHRLLAISDKFLKVFTALIATDEGNFSAEKTLAQWSDIKTALYIAMAFSVLVATILGAAYAVTIKRPLSRIRETCHRIASSEPLEPALNGRDELSELDRLFHALGESVDKALRDEKAMIENARDLICSLNSQGQFIKVNGYASELLGFEPTEVYERSLIDICAQDDTVRADDELRISCSTPEMRTFELALIRKDGEQVDTRWSCVWSESDEELFAVVHDISEEKIVERLKQDFVDMISHDLRSPLTSMLGSLSMIAAGARGALPEEADKEVQSAVRNVERLVEFINDLLDFQKLKAGRMQLVLAPVNLKDVVGQALETVKESIEAKHLDVVLPERGAIVRGDSNKLVQTVINLIANAIRFAPPKSAIKIEFEHLSNSLVEVRVIDSGPGIPEIYREQIFDAFAQVPSQKQSEDSTGLGLAICKLIVDAHGGGIGVRGASIEDLRAQSKNPNQVDPNSTGGSVFWIRLPVG